MVRSSTSGFDLREAVDTLRDAVDARIANRSAGRSARRDIRPAILTELVEQPMHGYQLIQAIEARSGGSWKPTPGDVYPTLQSLADEQLVTASQVGERKVYALTDAGRVAAAEAHDTDERQESSSRHGTAKLASSSVKLASALTQFPHVATSEQAERAASVIDEARRKLFAILAED